MVKFLKVLFIIVALVCLALLLLGLSEKPTPFAEDSQSAVVLKPGPFTVATTYNETFIDKTRPTNANGVYPGSLDRTLVGSVWYPEGSARAPYPLVVFSHGFSSLRVTGVYLGRQLASLGYVVVAVDYPLTNSAAPGGPNVKDVVNQPADISFLIDTLLAQSGDSEHDLAGKVDGDRIGVMGISLGGMTSTLAAFHPETGDSRIKAAMSIAGPTEQFTEVFFSHRQVPFLMLASDSDAVVSYEVNALPVLKIPGAQLVTIKQASHSGFGGPAGFLRWMDNPDAIGCYMVLMNAGDDLTQPWFDLIGTEEQGINYQAELKVCEDPLVKTMNPLRQQMITSVVVSSFFQSHFADSASERKAAQVFLSETLAKEVGDVEYARAE